MVSYSLILKRKRRKKGYLTLHQSTVFCFCFGPMYWSLINAVVLQGTFIWKGSFNTQGYRLFEVLQTAVWVNKEKSTYRSFKIIPRRRRKTFFWNNQKTTFMCDALEFLSNQVYLSCLCVCFLSWLRLNCLCNLIKAITYFRCDIHHIAVTLWCHVYLFTHVC